MPNRRSTVLEPDLSKFCHGGVVAHAVVTDLDNG